jgi:hypothetical protein
MANMRLVFTNNGTLGTYDFVANPSNYTHDEIALEHNERKVNGGLSAYNNGIYHMFTLSFDNIGTSQYNQFGTIFRTKAPLTFFPNDDVRGTNENFSVYWTGNFAPKLAQGYFGGGYQIDIVLEST